jgi:hypothetical protein
MSIFISVTSVESFVARFDGQKYIASIGDEIYTAPLLSQLIDIVESLPFPGALDDNYWLRGCTENIIILPFDNLVEEAEVEFDDSIPF